MTGWIVAAVLGLLLIGALWVLWIAVTTTPPPMR